MGEVVEWQEMLERFKSGEPLNTQQIDVDSEPPISLSPISLRVEYKQLFKETIMLLVTPNGFLGAETKPITIVKSSISIDENGKVVINGDNKTVTFQVQS